MRFYTLVCDSRPIGRIKGNICLVRPYSDERVVWHPIKQHKVEVIDESCDGLDPEDKPEDVAENEEGGEDTAPGDGDAQGSEHNTLGFIAGFDKGFTEEDEAIRKTKHKHIALILRLNLITFRSFDVYCLQLS